MKQLYFTNRMEWREWLQVHYGQESEVWLIFYKKGTGKPTMDYEAAVEEGLCFGWIDSIIKKIDDERYARKFTPRKEESKWSESNKRRVKRLIKNGLMTEIGMAKVKEAKESGRWDKTGRPQIPFELPEDFKAALDNNAKARKFFNGLAPSYRKQFIGWIAMAKRPETRAKRIEESIGLLKKGEKLGMK